MNPSQPQTLQIAVFLLYFNAAFTAIFGGLFSVFGLLIIAGSAAAGFGIANEQKWGYGVGVAMAFLPFALRLLSGSSFLGYSIINLMFEIALVALLLHPQSRDYQRIWFKKRIPAVSPACRRAPPGTEPPCRRGALPAGPAPAHR